MWHQTKRADDWGGAGTRANRPPPCPLRHAALGERQEQVLSARQAAIVFQRAYTATSGLLRADLPRLFIRTRMIVPRHFSSMT